MKKKIVTFISAALLGGTVYAAVSEQALRIGDHVDVKAPEALACLVQADLCRSAGRRAPARDPAAVVAGGRRRA